MNINKGESRGGRSKYAIGRMPGVDWGFVHAGFSLRGLEDKSEESWENLVSLFLAGWQAQHRSDLFEEIVLHEYKEQSDEQANHIHIVYKHYKNCTRTQFIRNFCEQHGVRFWFTRIGKLEAFVFYLHQHPRRSIHKKGRDPSAGFRGGVSDLREWEGTSGCQNAVQPRGGAEVCESVCSDDESMFGEGEQAPASGGIRATGEVPKTVKQRKSEELWDQLFEKLQQWRVTDDVTFSNRVYRSGEKSLINWYMHASTQKDWQLHWQTAVAKYCAWVKAQPWEVLLEKLPDDPKDIDPSIKILSIEESLYNLKYILKKQLGSMKAVEDFLFNCYLIMNRESGKRNTLYLKGPASAFKTYVCDSLAKSMHLSFKFQDFGKFASTFVLQDVIYRNILCLEEPNVDPSKIDMLKMILGGEPCDVNQKYKYSGKLERTPVVVTTNQDMWCYAPQAMGPIRERIYEYNFSPIPDFKVNGALHPKIYHGLIQLYGFRERANPSVPRKTLTLWEFDRRFQPPQSLGAEEQSDISELPQETSGLVFGYQGDTQPGGSLLDENYLGPRIINEPGTRRFLPDYYGDGGAEVPNGGAQAEAPYGMDDTEIDQLLLAAGDLVDGWDDGFGLTQDEPGNLEAGREEVTTEASETEAYMCEREEICRENRKKWFNGRDGLRAFDGVTYWADPGACDGELETAFQTYLGWCVAHDVEFPYERPADWNVCIANVL